MAKIDEFRSFLQGGGARPSQFKVNLNIPGLADASRVGQFMVKATTLPSSLITPIDVPFRGRIAKIAGERQFQNWTVTILNDNDFKIRAALEEWSRNILEHDQTQGILPPSWYVTEMQVIQLDRNDNELRTYQFSNCFPQVIGEIGLDFGNTTAIEEYQVEFSVDYWKVV